MLVLYQEKCTVRVDVPEVGSHLVADSCFAADRVGSYLVAGMILVVGTVDYEPGMVVVDTLIVEDT